MWPATDKPNASDSKRGLNGDTFEAAVVFESFLPLSHLFQSIEVVEGCSCGSNPFDIEPLDATQILPLARCPMIA
jgi:hypothetical protein